MLMVKFCIYFIKDHYLTKLSTMFIMLLIYVFINYISLPSITIHSIDYVISSFYLSFTSTYFVYTRLSLFKRFVPLFLYHMFIYLLLYLLIIIYYQKVILDNNLCERIVNCMLWHHTFTMFDDYQNLVVQMLSSILILNGF